MTFGRVRFLASLAFVLALMPPVLATAENPADALRDIERQRIQSLLDADVEKAQIFHADDFQLINPVGFVSSKQDYLGDIASGKVDYQVWDPGEIAVKVYGDAAVMRYESQLEVIVNGNRIPRRTHWHTDLYEKRDGRWQVVWSQASAQPAPLPD